MFYLGDANRLALVADCFPHLSAMDGNVGIDVMTAALDAPSSHYPIW